MAAASYDPREVLRDRLAEIPGFREEVDSSAFAHALATRMIDALATLVEELHRLGVDEDDTLAVLNRLVDREKRAREMHATARNMLLRESSDVHHNDLAFEKDAMR